ncbi:MAG: UvrD-helicase domain-containing protein [Ignavibacteriales bacterium]|nr:UvrD-helicase domain-containing protein [Ignavibacteriales bacterium]
MFDLTPQQKEAFDYKNHISLTANAGSGKTFVLSKRFVEILLNEEIDLSSIVAITFTDKAAGELNKKIAREIDERILSEENSGKRKKLEEIRRQLVSANISTIHSFCINILKEFSPEAEIDPNFNVIDQSTANEIFQLCVEDSINTNIKNPESSEELKYIIRYFGSKKAFISQLENSLNQKNTIDQISKKLYLRSENEIANYFRQEFETVFDKIFSAKISEIIILIRIINDFVLKQNKTNKYALDTEYVLNQFRPNLSSVSQIVLLKGLVDSALTKKYTVRIKDYLDKGHEEYHKQSDAINLLLQELIPFFSLEEGRKPEKELARIGKAFLKFFNSTNKLYADKKKQKGYLDFEDLLIFTQQVLQREEVQTYLREKFRYIMIDEYQDTNELQYEIFMPILDNLRSGNLFVVGDEKQSIYMFRNAELEVFNKTKKEICGTEKIGRLLSLPHSFRMAPSLVLFINKIFSNLFNNPDHFFNEVEHSELVCAKDENEIGKVEILLSEADTETEEYDLVAEKISKLVSDKEVELKDIAILCRKRDSFAELEKVFVKKNIPYSIVGGKGFYQRQIIYDIYNYLSFLLKHENNSALIGILRSPFFNISDLQLYKISLEEGDTFYEKLMNSLGKNSKLEEVYNRLNENLLIASSTEIYSLIRKILLESGYWAVIASKKNSSQEIANVEKLLLLARAFTQKSFKNLYDFTVSMRESIGDHEDEGQAQVTRDENSVKILTIHQAKGLEFKAVFLYNCNDTVKDSSVKSKSLICDKNFGVIAKVPTNGNYFNKYDMAPIVSLYNYIIYRKNLAEIKRLLYVGLTRAKNYLFISAELKKEEPNKNSFLDLILKGLNADYSANELNLSSKVQFMKLMDGEYKFYNKNVSLNVPIIRETEEVKTIEIKKKSALEEKIILTQKIYDRPKREIISATKISIFTQCPVKYQLTYELGFSTIYNLVKERSNEFEFSQIEDDELRQYAQLKGKLIHTVLKEEVSREELSKYLTTHLSLESFANDLQRNDFQISLLKEIEKYYDSNTYQTISKSDNYKNEFEVYCEEKEHYLYGIIDKLIIEKDKLIIIDYKTDNISYDQLNTRVESYIPQLTFYAYVLSKLYKSYKNFQLRLVFLKFTDELIVKDINRTDLDKYSSELDESIRKIYNSDYEPNLHHCSSCHYALEGNKCIKIFS